ncbi:MAG: TRAP transporter large permease subunit [Planctomycetaceae bacterium]|nr:MAG: TRAP transporter large permease subunit [Planctomycetaceae bacterium]
MQELGFDPVWYGIMVCIAVMQGQLTPPVGVNLNIVMGMVKDVPALEVYRWVLPYVLTLVVFMLIMLAFPEIALFLPSMMK